MYFENIRPEDIFRQRMNGRGILIDLRDPAAYEAGHIPGAVSIPYEELKEQTGKLRDLVMKKSMASGRAFIIVYCDRGNTSLKASGDLYKAGFRVKNVYGGMAAYKGPVVQGNL